MDKLKKSTNGAKMRWDPEFKEKIIKIYEKIKKECKKLNQRGLGKTSPINF